MAVFVMTCVRKHRAPKGALRLGVSGCVRRVGVACQKAPSAKRCIKTPSSPIHRDGPSCRQKAPSAKRRIKTATGRSCRCVPFSCQKAPSTKRRIKTYSPFPYSSPHCVSQKAPSVKRYIKTPAGGWRCGQEVRVRKHRAPKGALRHTLGEERDNTAANGQKAPSAKRCIRTT